MAWIKRNLFFFVGGLIALGLLGAAAYYNITSYSLNSEKLARLNEIYSTLTSLNDPKSSPGNDKVNKIDQAKAQEAELRKLLEKSRSYFKPIAPIPASTPNNPVTSEDFAATLRRTIDQLQHEAHTSNVELPNGSTGNDKYAFSFEAERSLVKFSPGSLEALALQLGEVKTISEILYAAGVNEFDGIQRTHVSDDDITGPQSDYISEQATTNDMIVMTPYVITFRSFGPEIARIFNGFAGSPNGFIIKSMNVQPAGGTAGIGGMAGGQGGMQPVMGQPMAAGAQGKNVLTTVLNEQLLRVSMEVEIVKLQAKN
jgi:hypothetical protein